MKGGRLRNLVFNTVLVAGSMLFALALLEVGVRTFDIGPRIYSASYDTFRLSANPVLGYELAPGAADGRHLINRFGMRDTDRALSKPRGVYRIAVVGDSIAYGWLLDRDQGFASALERKLNRDTPTRYQVLNFAVTGYNATQIAETVRSRIRRFDPDLVVYAYCLNDPQEYSIEMTTLLAQVPGVERTLLTESGLAWVRRSRAVLLAVHGYRSLFESDPSSADQAPVTDDPQFAALQAGTYVEYFRGLYTEQGGELRLRAAIRVMRSATDVPIVAVVFPLLQHLQDYSLEAVHQHIDRVFREQGLAVLDLLAAFRHGDAQGRTLRLDALHPTREGHALAARKTLAFLDREGLL